MKRFLGFLILLACMVSLTGFGATADLTENSKQVNFDCDVGTVAATATTDNITTIVYVIGEDVPGYTSRISEVFIMPEQKAISNDYSFPDVFTERVIKHINIDLPTLNLKHNNVKYRTPRDAL